MSDRASPAGAPLTIRLATYSTKARGGVVHALSLAEALADRGHLVELWALSPDGATFFRPPRVPTRLVPVERRADEPIDARILRYADVLAAAMATAGPVDINHAEDCLSARSMLKLRESGHIATIVRTIHHVDEFTSPVLDSCQRASIVDVDHRLCVSDHWVGRVREEFGVESDVVSNGVDAERFSTCPMDRDAAGVHMGWGARPTVLAVGGIEPRKGARTLLGAFAELRRDHPQALLAIAGGETLFDYRDYRDGWWADVARLGLRVHEGRAPFADQVDVVVLGPIEDETMPTLFRAADVLAFPSTLEGFGLVVLEAMAAGTPVVASDLPVLREHLQDGRDCLLVPVDDTHRLARAIATVVDDDAVRTRIVTGGHLTAGRFTWSRCAQQHERFYRRISADRG